MKVLTTGLKPSLQAERGVVKANSLVGYHPKPGVLRKCRDQLVVRAAQPTGPGGNVLDKPKTTPDIDKKQQTRKKKPPTYKVILHNDNFNKREYVVQVILKVIEGYTVDEAVNVMQEAHIYGFACVTQCAMEDAERYCEGMRGGGLVSSIEPAGP